MGPWNGPTDEEAVMDSTDTSRALSEGRRPRRSAWLTMPLAIAALVTSLLTCLLIVAIILGTSTDTTMSDRLLDRMADLATRLDATSSKVERLSADLASLRASVQALGARPDPSPVDLTPILDRLDTMALRTNQLERTLGIVCVDVQGFLLGSPAPSPGIGC
jgi:hypothetical protein